MPAVLGIAGFFVYLWGGQYASAAT